MEGTLISILVPVYNEEEFVGTILERAVESPLPHGYDREIIVVDDGSTDESVTVVEGMIRRFPGVIRLIQFEKNQGKGAAVRRAIAEARGEFCIIQDADLEYNPNEYAQMFEPLVDGVADAVYGSRFATCGRRRVLYYWHTVANRLLTWLCNVVADINLTDVETCYKAFRTSLVKSIPIRSNRFGIEPEVTIKVAKRQARIYEVPISYEGRTYEDGKKIGFRDAIEAVLVILRYAFSADLYKDPGAEILDSFSVAPRFNRWMADVVRPYVGSTVLEIGAGMGNLTRQMVNRRTRYVASDIDVEHLVRLRNRLRHSVSLEVSVCDLSKAEDFESFSGSMDTVICLNVLEHMADDRACAKNIYSALLPGGSAIILVPCGQEVFGQLDIALGHYRRYSIGGLTGVLESVGFSVERVIEFNRVSRPGWYISGRVLKRSRLSRPLLALFDRFVWIWRRCDRYLPFKPTSIIAIARRPVAAADELRRSA